MSDERSKPWYQQLPAKLGAVVVFLVAVTTLAGNVMELNDKRSQPAAPAVATPPPPPVAKPAAVVDDGPRKLRIAVDRIAVEHDGSPGTTDWRFTVEADGEPLLSFQQDDLDDTGGRNVARLRDVDATLRLDAPRAARLSIKGWRGSRFRLPGTDPDATGEGTLAAAGGIAPIRIAALEPDAGAFVFYLSADRL